MIKTNCNFVNKELPGGSALILTVVLTSMLAIVGILFVMMARVDKMATSAISENRELDLAVETVIARVSQQLILDVPGILVQEYYDYPDAGNPWLASLEPEIDDRGTPADLTDDIYYWRHISDVNNQLGLGAWNLPAVVIPDYQPPLQIGDSNALIPSPYPADADADGVSDSVWIKIPDITSSKGKPIYVAVRVVDNDAMLNANTHFKFDPNAVDANQIDGSSQLQVNLMGLSWRQGFSVYDPCDEIDLLRARANPAFGLNPLDLRQYERDVIWRYGRPNGSYTPFDISDELEMRYRYLLNHTDIDTRLEAWGGEFRINTFWRPVVQSVKLRDWFYSAYYDVGMPDPNYAYRHIATTYNMDRIIDPNGDKMINVNEETSPSRIYYALMRSAAPSIVPQQQYAQLAVNLVDFIDDDPWVSIFPDVNDPFFEPNNPLNPAGKYYGFDAQPFITEIGIILPASVQLDKSKPPVVFGPSVSSFAVELYNPFDCNIPLRDFELELFNKRTLDIRTIYFDPCDIIYAHSCFVISNNPLAFGLDPLSPNVIVRPELILFTEPDKSKPPVFTIYSDNAYDVFLKRLVSLNEPMIYVDRQAIDPNLALAGSARSFGRDVRDWRVIYQTLIEDVAYGGNLGIANNCGFMPSGFPCYPSEFFLKHLYSYFLPNPLYPTARLITVGDIPRLLTLGHGITRDSTIGQQLVTYELLELSTLVGQEHNVRLDVQNPLHSNVFQYLTVFDPNSDGIDNDADGLTDEGDGSEWKVPGRININTAPWYVLAQLPWVTHPFITDPSIARAIVAYRDKLPLFDGAGNLIADYGDRTAATGSPLPLREELGFASIGELAMVVNTFDAPNSVPNYRNFSMRYYIDESDLPYFPDLTTADDDPPYTIPDPCDEVIDDFEERDVIFSRISNLVTVRSDVFTAYILVRIGVDGPQKRVVAILDRSGVNRMNVGLPAGRVRIVSLHEVPDPR